VARFVTLKHIHETLKANTSQIEQFIETIFPSQKPGKAPTASGKPYKTAEEEEKAAKAAQETKWDTIYMGLAVLAVLSILTGFMVRVSPILPVLSTCFERLLTVPAAFCCLAGRRKI
jgi:hypothetical protein